MSTAGESSWALLRGARGAWERGREGWRALPAGAARRWAWGVALATGGTALLMAAITLLAEGNAALADRDRAGLLRLIESGPLNFHDAMWWEAFGSSSMLVPVALTATVLSALSRRPLLALTFAASYLLAKPIVLVGWTMWDRARPTLVAGGIAAPPLHSFPSGHAVQTATIYGLLVYLWARRSRSVAERAVAVLLWAFLLTIVSLARLRLGAHWPSDVLVGALIGTVWLVGLVAALRRADEG